MQCLFTSLRSPPRTGHQHTWLEEYYEVMNTAAILCVQLAFHCTQVEKTVVNLTRATDICTHVTTFEFGDIEVLNRMHQLVDFICITVYYTLYITIHAYHCIN